jgi:hypothetical protein
LGRTRVVLPADVKVSSRAADRHCLAKLHDKILRLEPIDSMR